MRFDFLLLFVLYATYPCPSYSVFSIQQTLTILCDQFPLISYDNNTNLQCARLRRDENIPIATNDLDRPSQIILFTIIDQPSLQSSPVNIILNFNQSLDLPSSINEIRLGLLVTNSNFIINNATTQVFTPYNIPIFQWQASDTNTYNLTDVLQLENGDYITDKSLCKWNLNQWNRLFNGNSFSNISYVYFLKTTDSQLSFTLINTTNKSSSLSIPSPYLDILYCVPYKLGTTEIVLLVCFGLIFITVVIILSISHYLKSGDDNQATRRLQDYYHRNGEDNYLRKQFKDIRHRGNISALPSEHDDQVPIDGEIFEH
ncbi:unnamed protein product [Adineta steineri]|uniref:Uncharacterized protein n=1 Tax=Adineta steineri TaxID=433720 RepID=A0A814BJT7_9BILA|nr:unnamed protein product [Adineta steineri]